MKLLHSQVVSGVAGSETVLLHLLPELQRRGHDVHFLCLHAARDAEVCAAYCERLADHGVTTHRLRYEGWHTPSTLKTLDQLVRDGGYALVHTHLIKADVLFAAARLAFRRSHVLVSTKHGYQESFMAAHGFDARHRRRDAYWWAAKFAETQMTASSSVSRGVGDFICALGIADPTRMHVTTLGFDYPPPPPARSPLRYGDPQLSLVGRLVELKGQTFAIRAIARLRDDYPEITLVLVGDGTARASLEALARELGVASNVVFAGRRDNPRDYIVASDVALVPSSAEGFGIVVLEAMACFRPVVAFDVPAPNEILEHGESGLLARPASVEDFTAQVRTLLENPDSRARMARVAHERLVTHFSLEAMADRFEAFYASVLGEAPRPTVE